MASYRGHLMFSSLLGVAYGGFAAWQLHLGWGPVFLGAGLTTVGGLLPDLDSDSGVPVRETFGLLAVVLPLLLLRRLLRHEVPLDETLVLVAVAYVVIRYGLSHLFKRLTVHRGMFHSIPAMFIAGLVVFLLDKGAEMPVRLFLAGGIMLGFLSHLVLDEIYSVDFMGLKLHLKKSAGSALKLASKSWPATLTCYAILAGLALLAWRDLGPDLEK
ncbi:MAG TPA: metal-dependent hydrolase [Gemmataceae bacterium]|nr:metal-dependent hydrolase [Gemmataceae bacterium]